jgi:hypothetical protein
MWRNIDGQVLTDWYRNRLCHNFVLFLLSQANTYSFIFYFVKLLVPSTSTKKQDNVKMDVEETDM